MPTNADARRRGKASVEMKTTPPKAGSAARRTSIARGEWRAPARRVSRVASAPPQSAAETIAPIRAAERPRRAQ